MRMQFGTMGFIALAITSLGATSGCSDISAGRKGDPPGPPRVERILVQDVAFAGGPPAERGAASDLLDHDPAPTCSEIDQCINQFLIAQNLPDLTCSAAGVCIDPLAVPDTGVPLNSGGNSIRIVFNKLIANVENVTTDPNGAPMGTGMAPYMINAGLVELLGPDGNPAQLISSTGVPAPAKPFWDATGVFDFTSDPILVPFGPAIVINGRLAPKTTYTVRLHPTKLADKQGRTLVGKDGETLPDPYDVKFTTEDLTLNPDSTYPNFAKTPTKISRNEIISLSFWGPVKAPFTTTFSASPAGFDPTTVEAYFDIGSDPTMCPKAVAAPGFQTGNQVDIANTTGPAGTVGRTGANWPAGDYTLTFTAPDATGTVTFTKTASFTVVDMDAAKATNTFAKHILPEQCK